MAVKAKAEITLYLSAGVKSVTRYYKLQSSTASAPSKPTANPPSGWAATEPSYVEGSTNSLYTSDLTVLTDGTWAYSEVSLSSSYEAAKLAYNKAYAAAQEVAVAKNDVAELKMTAEGIEASVASIVETDMPALEEALSGTNAALGELQEAQQDLVTASQFEEYKTSVEQTSTDIALNFASEVKRLEDGILAEVETRSGLIRAAMGLGDEDEAGVEIGVSDSELSSVFTNKRLAFRRNNVDIVYVSAEKERLGIKAAEIEEELQLGKFQWQARPNGNMGLVWIGGDE